MPCHYYISNGQMIRKSDDVVIATHTPSCHEWVGVGEFTGRAAKVYLQTWSGPDHKWRVELYFWRNGSFTEHVRRAYDHAYKRLTRYFKVIPNSPAYYSPKLVSYIGEWIAKGEYEDWLRRK